MGGGGCTKKVQKILNKKVGLDLLTKKSRYFTFRKIDFFPL